MRAFGTNSAVFVFLISVTDIAGIEICEGQDLMFFNKQANRKDFR